MLFLAALGAAIAFAVISARFYNVQRNVDMYQKLHANAAGRASQIITTVLLGCVELVAMFLVVSCIVGIVILRRRGVSRDAVVGLLRFLVIAVVVWIAFSMRLIVDALKSNTWYVPDWLEFAVVHLLCMTASSIAFLCFVWFAVQRQRSSRSVKDSDETSTELLIAKKKIPASYEI